MLYQALSPALSPVVALVPPLLEHASGGSKEAALAAQGMLRLQVSVIECLGKEVSKRALSSIGSDSLVADVTGSETVTAFARSWGFTPRSVLAWCLSSREMPECLRVLVFILRGIRSDYAVPP